MTLRAKLVVALVVLSAVATGAVGWFAYTATASRLRIEIDRSLDARLRALTERVRREPDRFAPVARALEPPGRFEGFDLIVMQYLSPSGAVLTSGSASVVLPVGDAERALAGSSRPGATVRRDVWIDDEHFRLTTVALGGGAVQAARSLAENDRLLASLRGRIVLIALAVAVTAATLGWLIARQLTRRLEHLTATAEHVATTGRLDVPVAVAGVDEAGRLAGAFNEMLGALARSKQDQQRLVEDAGHELRTPLTSLRTNVSVLRRFERLSPEQLRSLLDDLDGETRELTSLVNELVELATDQRNAEPETEVRLADLAERVAERARRRTGRSVVVDADGSIRTIRARAVERAIANLVDNAAKFDAHGAAPIEVVVRDGRVEVRDRGPGIDPADLPHLFDRFYRSVAARSQPGSGLGLSIVRETAESHGGSVFAEQRPGGGAVIGFTLP